MDGAEAAGMGDLVSLIKILIIPVFLTFFKNEIGNLLKAWNVYKLRAFDLDGNPGTPDKAQLLNGATGQWGDIMIEKYVFSFSAKTRGVYIRYPDGGREKIMLVDWAKMRKRTPPPEKTADEIPG